MKDTKKLSGEDFKKIEELISFIKEKKISNVRELDTAVSAELKWNNAIYGNVIGNIMRLGIIHFLNDDIRFSQEMFDEAKKTVENKKKRGDDEEKEENILFKSFYECDGKLYEQVMDNKNNISSFACYDGTAVSYVEKILNENRLILPIANDAVEKKAVLLPEKAEDFVNIETLLAEIKEHIHKYVDLSKDFEEYAAYYVLLSWIFDKLNTIVYLRFLGDTGCGKSRAMDVIGRICYKPILISGAVTPAPMFRMIDVWGGTVLIDEGDRRQSDTSDDIVKILNCGFERFRPVIRCDKDDPNDLQFFNTFCPKIISSRFSFFDKALEARCLTEKMEETERTDIPPQLPNMFFEKEKVLRNKLLMFRLKNRELINADDIQKIDFGNIEPRLKQANASFGVLFANFPNIMEKFKTFLSKYQKELIEERSNTLEGFIIRYLADNENSIMNREDNSDIKEYITPKMIEENLSHDFKDLNVRTIGKMLRSLGIVTKQTKIEGKNIRAVSVKEGLFNKLKKRYIISDSEVSTVSSVALVAGRAEVSSEDSEVSTVSSVALVAGRAEVSSEGLLTEGCFNLKNNNIEVATNEKEKTSSNNIEIITEKTDALPATHDTDDTNATKNLTEKTDALPATNATDDTVDTNLNSVKNLEKCIFNDCENIAAFKTQKGAPVCLDCLKVQINNIFINEQEQNIDDMIHIVSPEADKKLLETGFWFESGTNKRKLTY